MSSIERDVVDRLERAGVEYYVTGSEALAVWAEPRQSMDIDIVTDLRDDAWGRIAFERRRLVDDPVLGSAWFIGPEDLILAKLAWSDGGASERQVRDAASVVRITPDLDWDHIERYASILGVVALVEQIRGDR